MNRRLVVVGVIAVASIGIAIFSYYSFMPAWLLVERIDGTEHDIVELPPSALTTSQELEEALRTVDERYSPGLPRTNAFKLSNSEGNKILELLREHDALTDGDSRFRIENGGKFYLVSILFSYEAPALA